MQNSDFYCQKPVEFFWIGFYTKSIRLGDQLSFNHILKKWIWIITLFSKNVPKFNAKFQIMQICQRPFKINKKALFISKYSINPIFDAEVAEKLLNGI